MVTSVDTNAVTSLPTELTTDTPSNTRDKKPKDPVCDGMRADGGRLELDLLKTILPEGEVRGRAVLLCHCEQVG